MMPSTVINDGLIELMQLLTQSHYFTNNDHR